MRPLSLIFGVNMLARVFVFQAVGESCPNPILPVDIQQHKSWREG
jgi:hypothetical protein